MDRYNFLLKISSNLGYYLQPRFTNIGQPAVSMGLKSFISLCLFTILFTQKVKFDLMEATTQFTSTLTKYV